MPLLKKLLWCLAGNQGACGFGDFSKNVIVGSGDKKDKFFKPQSKLGENFNSFPGNAGQNRSPLSVSGPEGFQEKQSTSSHSPSFISPVPALVEKEFQDPVFCQRVAGLERMLRVRARNEHTSDVGHSLASGSRDLVTDSQVQGVAPGRCSAEHSVCEVPSVDTDLADPVCQSVSGDFELVPDPVFRTVSGDFDFVPDPVLQTVCGNDELKRDLDDGIVAVRATTAGERNHSRLLEVIESVFLSLISCSENSSSPSSLRVSSHKRAHEICRAAAFACLPHPHSALHSACRSLPALPVAHADDPLMHDVLNSSLRVQRATSYNPEGVVALNSRRKVRLTSTVRFGSVEQTVDMSPAPAAGTYRRSVDEMHGQRQVSRKRWTKGSWGGPGPGPGLGPGGRSGPVGGASGFAAVFREIPRSLVMPPGRHQRAPQSLGWERVCGTEKSGVWVLKGDARTYTCLET